MIKKKFYITTPIYYPNAEPHIGSLYTTVLADVISRYQQILGKDVFFLTGTDEHGQKIQETALKAEKSPKSFVDSIIPIFKDTFNAFHIKYSLFMRTTNEDHILVVQKWIHKMIEREHIYKSFYEGWYLSVSESFIQEKDILERDIDGTPLCSISKKRAEWIREEAYFFKLSEFEKPLLDFLDKNPDWIIPFERKNEVVEFIKSGLKDLCISRSKKQLSWGIPFPGDNDFVVYVWADALNNYITGAGYLLDEKKFNEIWPADIQLIGKDILRFHAIFWPAFLMASDLPLPKHLLTHGWILVNNQKMSKSLGNVVNPMDLLNKYGVDRVRYYLTKYIPITQDGSFSDLDLEEKTDHDLSNTFGNLIQRIITLSIKNEYTVVSLEYPLSVKASKIFEESLLMVKEFKKEMDRCYFHIAYTRLMEFLYKVNSYVNDTEPWKVFKNDIEEFKEIVGVCLNSIYTSAVLLSPILVEQLSSVFSQLGIKENNLSIDDILVWNKIFYINNPVIIYPSIIQKKEKNIIKTEKNKMEEKEVKKIINETKEITIDDFTKIEIRVGYILAVEDIQKSDKLYKLTVDFGSEYGKRIICSGVKEYFNKEDILGKKTAFVYNLQKKTLRGVDSQGMILMATNSEKKPTIVQIDISVELGTLLK